MALVDAPPVVPPHAEQPALRRSRGWIGAVLVLALIVSAVIVGQVAAGRARSAADLASHQALVMSAQGSLDRAVIRLSEVPVGERVDGDLPGAPSLDPANLGGDGQPLSVQTTLVQSTADVVVAYVVVRSNG